MKRTRYLAALPGTAVPGPRAPLLRPPRRLFGYEPPSLESPSALGGLDVRSAQPASSARDGEPRTSRPPASGFDDRALGRTVPTPTSPDARPSTAPDARSDIAARQDGRLTGVQRALRPTRDGEQHPSAGPDDAYAAASTPGIQHATVMPAAQHAAEISAARGSVRGERLVGLPTGRAVQQTDTTSSDTNTTSSEEDPRTRAMRTGTGPTSRRQTPTSPREAHAPRSPRSVAAADMAAGARPDLARRHGPTRRAPRLRIGTIEVRVTAPQTQLAAPAAPAQPSPQPRPSTSARASSHPLATAGPPRWFGLAQR